VRDPAESLRVRSASGCALGRNASARIRLFVRLLGLGMSHMCASKQRRKMLDWWENFTVEVGAVSSLDNDIWRMSTARERDLGRGVKRSISLMRTFGLIRQRLVNARLKKFVGC